MSYFDPDLYNYDALKDEDKKLIRYFDFAVETVENKDFIIEDLLGVDGDSTLDTIKREIAEETLDAALEYLASQRMELIVSMMDNYTDED